jgi:hypothetical protein
MNTMMSLVAAATLGLVVAFAPVERAKADGGVVAVSVGAYLVVDYIVGRKCDMHVWPFNIIHKTAQKVRGQYMCKHYRRSARY